MKEYKYSVKLRDKEITFRKWKVKDKKAFVQSVELGDPIKSNDIVYACLEDPTIPLTDLELKWVLLNIRAKSLGETLKFEIECGDCFKDYDYNANILEIQRPNFKPFDILKSGDITIKMGNISNKQYYEDAISQCNTEEEKFFIDFLYHVQELNGSDAFTFESLYDYINELDINIGEDIFKQWKEMSFSFDNIKEIECPHCGYVENIEFDELYGFFPNDWFE